VGRPAHASGRDFAHQHPDRARDRVVGFGGARFADLAFGRGQVASEEVRDGEVGAQAGVAGRRLESLLM